MTTRVVVWDPAGELAEGTVFSGPRAVAALHERGLVTLPCDTDLMAHHALGGFFRRAWGAGWEFDRVQPIRGCPMVIWAVPERVHLHWVARVMPIREGEQLSGLLRLTSGTTQEGTLSSGIAADQPPAELGKLGDPDAQGGWLLRGRSRLNLATSGLLALNLCGAVSNARVPWAAVTISRQSE